MQLGNVVITEEEEGTSWQQQVREKRDGQSLLKTLLLCIED